MIRCISGTSDEKRTIKPYPVQNRLDLILLLTCKMNGLAAFAG